tara:strand:- start:117 stop:3473 length:3357 start_codon:yes stop_codon:yes gene_type:complete
MTDPLIHRASKIYAWLKVGQLGAAIANDSVTSMTVDSGHRMINGMDVLIGTEMMTVSAITGSTDTAITIDRGEYQNTKNGTVHGREIGGAAAAHADNSDIFAWSELIDSDGLSLAQSFTIEENMYKPRTLQLTLSNFSATTKFTVGLLDGLLKESTPLKVVHGVNYSVLFSGKIIRVTKQHALNEGNTLQITAADAFYEMGRIKTVGKDAIVEIKNINKANSSSFADVADAKISSIIELLVRRFQFSGITPAGSGSAAVKEHNVTTTPGVSGSEAVFEDSRFDRNLNARGTKISFAGSNNYLLKAISRLALTDQLGTHTYGYQLNINDNFTSVSTAHNPPKMLTYAKSGFSPGIAETTSPSTGNLTFQYYFESDPVTENGGTRLMKSGASFDNLDVDKVNVINARWTDSHTGKIRNLEFELFNYIGVTKSSGGQSLGAAFDGASGSTGGKKIVADADDADGTNGVHDLNLNSLSPSSWKPRVVDADDNVIGYLQFASTGTSVGGSLAGFALLSGTSTLTAAKQVVAGENLFLDTAADADFFTLTSVTDPEAVNVFRPQQVLEQKVMVTMDFGVEENFNNIREAVAARFAQKSIPKVRGRFQISNSYPCSTWENVIDTGDSGDTIATTADGSKTVTELYDNTMGGSVTTSDGIGLGVAFTQLGLRAGHSIGKLTAQHGDVDTFGYLSKVTTANSAAQLTFMLNSGTVSNGDYYRLHVPLRTGHVVKVRSTYHGITATTGGNALVTAMTYYESGGSAYTDIETVGQRQGTGQDVIAFERPDYAKDLDDSGDDGFDDSQLGFGLLEPAHYTGIFKGGQAGGSETAVDVQWTEGYLYVGGRSFKIAAGSTNNATFGLNTTMPFVDTNDTGISDTRNIVFFDPNISEVAFCTETEASFETQNATAGRGQAFTNPTPFAARRLRIATVSASKTGTFPLINLWIQTGASKISNQSDAEVTGMSSMAGIIGGRQLSGNVAYHWLPTITENFDLGTAAREWKDLHIKNEPTVNSDSRKKKNIADIELGLDFINDLKPRKYDWILDATKIPRDLKGNFGTNQTMRGLIAQEVIQALATHGIDDLADFAGISINPETGFYSAKYNQFVAILIKAVQELSAKVKALEDEG